MIFFCLPIFIMPVCVHWRILVLFALVFPIWGQIITGPLQRQSLVRLYEATNGDNWLNNDNWLVGEPCVNNWYGIECDNYILGGEGVTFIQLQRNNLSGTLPESLLLANLEMYVMLLALLFYFSHCGRNLEENNIGGTLPGGWTQMLLVTTM